MKQIIADSPMRITPYYLSLIDWSDDKDPIRKMAVPSPDALYLDGSFDTSGEFRFTKVRGLQHKYAQTALILATHACAMYCRHCFRKRLVGMHSDETAVDMDAIVDYIRRHNEINNVLISGGDPLTLSTAAIENMLKKLSHLRQLEYIRIGTRVPVVDPERITQDEELLHVLNKYCRPKRKIYVITQFNHPNEITPYSREAVHQLCRTGAVINNQAVLMKDVNDDAQVMAKLQRRITSMGVNPYYIFQCRSVSRVKRGFQVPLRRGLRIIEKARTLLDGISKRFRYAMSHEKGKIEILGDIDDCLVFKYHQAVNRKNAGRVFKIRIDSEMGWLENDVLDLTEKRCLRRISD